MLFPQGYGATFGEELVERILDPATERVDVATAWIRASGVRHVLPGLRALLGRGGGLRIVVGLDCDNTSVEGLQGLLSLRSAATADRASFWVRHNEAGLIFHPKVYAVRDGRTCSVYVGSNNLTEAGLFRNEELTGKLSGPRGSALEADFDAYFGKLTNDKDATVRRLDDVLLASLVEHGYVEREARLAGKTATRARRGRKQEPLFGSKHRRPPMPPVPQVVVPGPDEVLINLDDIEPDEFDAQPPWTRIFLRLSLSRGTQGQIPKPVARSLRRALGLQPRDGRIPVVLRDGDRQQEIIPTGNRADPNTYKFEAVQTEGETLMTIEIIGGTVFVEKLDGAQTVGRTIADYILQGLADGSTQYDKSKAVERATLYRYD